MFKCLNCETTTGNKTNNNTRDSDMFSIIKCSNCGLVQLYPLPSTEEDNSYYNEDSQSMAIHFDMEIDSIIEKAKPDTLRRIHFINNIIEKRDPKDVSLLEIGSGYGLFLKYADQYGYDIEGIEISKIRRDISSSLSKVPVHNFNLIDKDIHNFIFKKYDFITMFHVLEHIKSPISFLENIKNILKKDGKLIVEVPNINDHLIKISPPYNAFYWQRAHLTYFSPFTLESILNKAGFSSVNIMGFQRYSIENAMNWLLLGEPQINKPAYTARTEIKWIDDYYRMQLEDSLTCDTLIAIAEV